MKSVLLGFYVSLVLHVQPCDVAVCLNNACNCVKI